jgi:hypothetical protein
MHPGSLFLGFSLFEFSCSSNRDNELIQTATNYSLESIMHQIMDQLATTGDILLEGEETCWQFYPSLLFTKGLALHKKTHLDFPKAEFMKKGRVPFILHLPLCKEGLALQIWSTWEVDGRSHVRSKLISVPFGCALLLRVDLYHAGCYGTKGNLRLHGMILPPDLPRNTWSLQHLREGTNTAFHNLQKVKPLFVLDSLSTEKNKRMTDHHISLLRKQLLLPCFGFWNHCRTYMWSDTWGGLSLLSSICAKLLLKQGLSYSLCLPRATKVPRMSLHL